MAYNHRHLFHQDSRGQKPKSRCLQACALPDGSGGGCFLVSFSPWACGRTCPIAAWVYRRPLPMSVHPSPPLTRTPATGWGLPEASTTHPNQSHMQRPHFQIRPRSSFRGGVGCGRHDSARSAPRDLQRPKALCSTSCGLKGRKQQSSPWRMGRPVHQHVSGGPRSEAAPSMSPPSDSWSSLSPASADPRTYLHVHTLF